MNPDEANARFVLNKLTSDRIVALSNTWLESGIYTDSLGTLCLIDEPTMSEVAPLFTSAMNDLGLTTPDRLEAANILIEGGLSRISEGCSHPLREAEFLYRHVHQELLDTAPDKDYLGDSLGLEYLFCWLREIWDCRDGSTILYYSELPRQEAESKFFDHLRESAAQWLDNKKHNKAEMATPRNPSD